MRGVEGSLEFSRKFIRFGSVTRPLPVNMLVPFSLGFRSPLLLNNFETSQPWPPAAGQESLWDSSYISPKIKMRTKGMAGSLYWTLTSVHFLSRYCCTPIKCLTADSGWQKLIQGDIKSQFIWFTIYYLYLYYSAVCRYRLWWLKNVTFGLLSCVSPGYVYALWRLDTTC